MQIREHAAANPDKPAVIIHPSGTVLTFAELEARANRLAHFFRKHGLREGDAVAILMENNEHYHAVMWAARRCGLYYVPINTHLTAAEAAYIIDNSSAKAIVGSAALRKTCENLGEHTVPDLRIIADGAETSARSASTIWTAGTATPNALRISLIHRSTMRSKAICCSTRRAPPAGRRASSASFRTCHRPRCPA